MEEEKKGDKDKQNKKRKNKVLNDISRKSMLNGYKQMTRKELEQHLQTVDSTLDDPEEEEMGSNIKKLQKQLEFYFGDSNLRNDKFLRELIFENNKGYVDLSVFLKFNKVKQILGDMDVEEDKIKALVDACSTSLLLKLNKDKTKVRRKIPFTQETLIKHQEEMDRRTVYVEDIPEDTNHEAIAHVFSKCGKILHVSLPKYSESKTLKGFGFIEFSTEEEAKKAVETMNNSVPTELMEMHQGKISALKVMPKVKWLELKEEFKKIKRELLQLQNHNSTSDSDKKESTIPKGCLLRLRGVPKDNVDKATIKALVSNFCQPKYVDYRKGWDSCIVRFASPQNATDFLEKYTKEKLSLNGQKLTVEPITGEEEERYLDQVQQYQANLRKQHNKEAKTEK